MKKINTLASCFIFAFFLCSTSHNPEFTISSYEKTIHTFPKQQTKDFFDDTIDFNTTNDLTKHTGVPFLAVGKSLNLHGYVRDVDGVPVNGVKIKIIQTNHYGAYNYKLSKSDPFFDKNFHSTGVAITNNAGYYAFKTIIPGTQGKRTPYIHFLVMFENYTHNFQMFFKQHPRNLNDPIYSKLSRKNRKLLEATTYWTSSSDRSMGKTAKFDIILNHIQPTKKIS